jgi:hypothetical protein
MSVDRSRVRDAATSDQPPAEGRDGQPPRSGPRPHDAKAYWQRVVAIFVGITIVTVAGTTALAGVAPASPTPAALVTRTVATPAPTSPLLDSRIPPPGDGARTPQPRRRVRLKQTVLVHTAPSADSPQAAISLLGEGMVAAALDRQGEWVLIEYGPLSGWTRADTVEEIE